MPEQRVVKPFMVCAVVAAVFVCYWPVRHHEFINYDDPQYITQNGVVQNGFTRVNVAWAFTTFDVANWHPVTWVSHMADVQLHGLDAGRHLLMNVFLHAINSVLVLLLFDRMNLKLWQSACAASVFALHPLHVESVAWVSERKDLLSALFGLLAILAYLKFARSRGAGWYAATVLFFSLSLMAKPMLVTLPFVMVLIDYWPLRRWAIDEHNLNPGKWARLLIEKLPLLALTVGSCIVTVIAQQQGGAVKSGEQFPLTVRVGNAAVSYAHYLFDVVWPSNLAVIYPYLTPIPIWHIVGALALLGAISIACWQLRQTQRGMLVGWLIFLGTLVPVLGFVQVGVQPRADRYMYFPMVGLLLMVFGANVQMRSSRQPQYRMVVTAIMIAALAALYVNTRTQLRHWRNSVTLFQHAIDVTNPNVAAELQLAIAWGDRGNVEKEYEHYQRVLELDPTHAIVHNNMGHDLLAQGQAERAIEHFTMATQRDPQFARALFNLGTALASIGQHERAVDRFQEALHQRPNMVDAYTNMGISLQRLGKLDDSAAAHAKAVELEPDSYIAQFNVAGAFFRLKRHEDAVRHYRRALSLNPSLATAHVRLGDIASVHNQRSQAIEHYRNALRVDPANREAASALDGLETQQLAD